MQRYVSHLRPNIIAGAVFCLGANRAGQLDDGTIINRYLTSAVVSGLPSDVTEISSGNYHTCASTSRGELYGWRGNDTEKLELERLRLHSL